MKPTRASGVSRRIGLARILSKLGYCSRAQGFELVSSGRVVVNGVLRRDPEYPVRPEDVITIDGKPVESAPRIYLVMNKPRGVVTTASDERGRATVYSLLDSSLPWVAPVGRLDKASEGLLLFTNDSEWAARIASPDSHVEKTYRVQVAIVADESLPKKLQQGIEDRGEHLRAVRLTILRASQKNSWLEVVLDEGRNRQLRRMFDALGIEVLRLIRVAVGPLSLGSLAKGEVRPLTTSEIEALDPYSTRPTAVRKSSPNQA